MQYNLTYEQNGVYQGVVIDAMNAELAEKFFRTQRPDARICSTMEAQPVMSVPHDWHLTRGPLYGTPLMAETLLSVRTAACLHQFGIDNLGELISVSSQDLRRINSLGPDVMAEISAVLEKHGVEFDAAKELQSSQPAPIRKIALSEKDFYAAENRADGFKFSDIPGGRDAVQKALDRIIEYGYEGVIPEGVVPKYSAEELCRRAYSFEKTPPRFVFLPEFKCGFKKESGPLTPESDIRNLDLSFKLFTSLNKHFGCYHDPMHTPIQLKHILCFTEEDLRSHNFNRCIRYVGNDGVDELKAELAKHGLEFGQVSEKESPEMVAYSKLDKINPRFEGHPRTTLKKTEEPKKHLSLDAVIANASMRAGNPGPGGPTGPTHGPTGPGGR